MILEKFFQSSETFKIPTEYLFSIRCDYCEHVILLVLPQPTYHRASWLKHIPPRHKIQMNGLLSHVVMNKYHMWEPSKGLTHTHTCSDIHLHAQREREKHKPTCIHTQAHTYTRDIHTHVHTEIHIQTYIQIYIYNHPKHHISPAFLQCSFSHSIFKIVAGGIVYLGLAWAYVIQLNLVIKAVFQTQFCKNPIIQNREKPECYWLCGKQPETLPRLSPLKSTPKSFSPRNISQKPEAPISPDGCSFPGRENGEGVNLIGSKLTILFLGDSFLLKQSYEPGGGGTYL